MDQIQVNIASLLLLVAVKSKPCLWRDKSLCKAFSQPCVVSTEQAARPLDSSPEVIARSSGAVCRPLPHFAIFASRKRETSYS